MEEKLEPSCGILIRCGNRYLLVHATQDTAPLLVDDNQWGIPKGRLDGTETELSCAIREVFEETGIDLTGKRSQIYERVRYTYKKREYVVFQYCDHDQVLMNHLFYCKSKIHDSEIPEVDRYYWVTESEFENLVAKKHKGKIFTKQKKIKKTKKV